MSRDPRLFLDDMLESIDLIKEYVASMDFQAFSQDRKTQDAVVRNLEIIGEAAGRLPDSCKEQAVEIEWRKIVALRNLLIHEYFGISVPIVWDVVQHKLGSLEIVCRRLLEERRSQERDER
jgi:uncharacterized protein with HEPN domain